MSSIASVGGIATDNIVRDYEIDTGDESCTIESRCDLHLETVDGEMTLMPSNKVDGSISAIFKMYLHPMGFAWKMVPMDKRMFYWTEFKKEYRWACTDDEILPIFWKKCVERYTNLLYHMKMDYLAGTKPEYVKDEDWPGWIAYWEAEFSEEKSVAAGSSSSSRGGLMYTQEELDARLEMQAEKYENFITQMQEMYDRKFLERETKIEAKIANVKVEMEKQMESMFERLLKRQSEGSKGHDGGGSS